MYCILLQTHILQKQIVQVNQFGQSRTKDHFIASQDAVDSLAIMVDSFSFGLPDPTAHGPPLNAPGKRVDLKFPSSHLSLFTQFTIMALLVDKHRPRNLEALSYHPDLSDRLKALVSSSSIFLSL